MESQPQKPVEPFSIDGNKAGTDAKRDAAPAPGNAKGQPVVIDPVRIAENIKVNTLAPEKAVTASNQSPAR